MRPLRRLAVLGGAAVGAFALAAPAVAGPRPTALQLPATLGTAHFLVHYQSDGGVASAITQTQAGDIAALAERAYAFETGDGFPAPLSDGGAGGDARIDIYVAGAGGAVLGYTDSDTTGFPADAFIVLDATNGITLETVAHELFHAIQFGIWRPDATTQPGEQWLLEATAEWMAYRAAGYPSGVEVGPSDMALDCLDPLYTSRCDLTDDYMNDGYSRWPFFQYLIERYGTSFVKDIFDQGAAGVPTSIAAISKALAAKGTTLSDTYNAWTNADMTASYGVKDLQALKPIPYASVLTGAASGSLTIPAIDVNHLSTRFVRFRRGDGDASHSCYAATLAISVALPAGTLSQPAFYWDAKGSTPVELAVNGSTATATVPWDTCTYPSTNGYLSIPNASTTVDAADFVVSATLTVDTTTPATPSAPPDPVTVDTPVVPVSSDDVAPTLELFGPEILRLSATDTQLRLIVSSTGQGSVHGRLGSLDLGTVAIRAGANDVRFRLPKSALKALRRSASAANVLTLTPVSSSGAATGKPVSRTVRVAAPKKTRRHT